MRQQRPGNSGAKERCWPCPPQGLVWALTSFLLRSRHVGSPDVPVELPRTLLTLPNHDVFASIQQLTVVPWERVLSDFVGGIPIPSTSTGSRVNLVTPALIHSSHRF